MYERWKRKIDDIEKKYERQKLGERPNVVEEKIVAVGEKRKALEFILGEVDGGFREGGEGCCRWR